MICRVQVDATPAEKLQWFVDATKLYIGMDDSANAAQVNAV